MEAILLRVTLKTVLPAKWRKKGNENEKEKSKAAVNRLNELLDFCQLYWLFELQLKLSYPNNSIHAPLALIYVINRENITPANSLNYCEDVKVIHGPAVVCKSSQTLFLCYCYRMEINNSLAINSW